MYNIVHLDIITLAGWLVAQRQSVRLLTGGLQVRILPGQQDDDVAQR